MMTDNPNCHGNYNSKGAEHPPRAAWSRRTRNRRGTTAGHIWSEREPVRQRPPSTCAFAAPGVGLEPTTYGLTVRACNPHPRPSTRASDFPDAEEGQRVQIL
jgi:hypothetical protein